MSDDNKGKKVYTAFITFKSGTVERFLVHTLTVSRSPSGEVVGLEWELAQPRQLLYINLAEITLVTMEPWTA